MHSRDKIYFHNFLTGMRTGKDITLEQLSLGLCTPAMLSLIEADKRQPDKLTRDRLTERLGFENDGFEDFLQPDEYEQWQNRDRLLRAVDAGDIPEAERLLELLEQEMAEDSIVFRQFVLTMRAQLMQYKKASREELREAFGRAMSLTMPDVASGTWTGRLLAGTCCWNTSAWAGTQGLSRARILPPLIRPGHWKSCWTHCAAPPWTATAMPRCTPRRRISCAWSS